MPQYKFINSEEELTDNVTEMNNYPLQWREVVGNAPKYFVHVENGENHLFGLSKFCAFENITVESYLSKYRRTIGGGTTQNYIKNVTHKEWTLYELMDFEFQSAFSEWIHSFFPNYRLNNSFFITLTPTTNEGESQKDKREKRKKKKITPEELAERLEVQIEIGQIGELIAIKYEKQRLLNLGFPESEIFIEQVSLKDVAKGYDIYSKTKDEERYIEVKSSITNNEYFITENEKNVLEQLGNNGFIYIVRVSNFDNKEGEVIREIQNPIPLLSEELRPVLYKVRIK